MIDQIDQWLIAHPYVNIGMLILLFGWMAYMTYRGFTMTDEEAIEKFTSAVFKDDPTAADKFKRFLSDD